ncbi:MAG: sensor histidine kinase [Peptostreptococcaceae bacterium]
MDIKSKNNKIVNVIIVISVLIASIGMCLVYPQIKKDSEKFKYNIFETQSSIYEKLNKISYSLYYDLNNSTNKEAKPSDILIDTELLYKEQNEAEYNEIIKRFDDEIYNTYNELINKPGNIEYYAINKDPEQLKRNLKININDKEVDNKIKEKYQFYIELDYDTNGSLTIEKLYGANKYEVNNLIYRAQNEKYQGLWEHYYVDKLEINPIKNMKFIYAVPKNLIYQDSIRFYNDNMEYSAYSSASYLFINIALAFVVLIGLFIPYKDIKQTKLFNKILNIPSEIIILIVLMSIGFIYGSTEILVMPTLNNELIKGMQLQLPKEVVTALIYLINIVYWAICFSIIILGISIIKHISKGNFKIYIKEKSLTYKLIRYIGSKFKQLYNWCTSVDLQDKNNKKLVIILSLNLIVVILMCSIWMFGVIAAFIYTAVLFILIKKKYIKVQDDYEKLLQKTIQIANGNLDKNTDEDYGIFNSLNDEIKNIQTGFKKAVDEEVKSQKMKTDLISNVSHDLKTPLTSIITYIDLLKNENIQENKRKEYIDILDKKSQRLQGLIEDLFEVSKASSGNISLNLINVDVISLMKQTLLELDDKIKESDLTIRCNYPNDKVVLTLDSQRTYRVFENLIVNITKYAMPHSRVYIDIVDNENKVEISFKNMAEQEINFTAQEISERFVRGDKSRNTQGSGLGLAIAKSFIDLQGGKFDIIIDGDLFKVMIVFQK